MKTRFLLLILVLMVPLLGRAQTVNSGSNGSDGAFHPKTNTVIDMADHPDGIYHYTSVHVPAGVAVTFKPNARNTPVVWLVQGDVQIDGKIAVNGDAGGDAPGEGGPGGWRGGRRRSTFNPATAGEGPGGGGVGIVALGEWGGNASHATEAQAGSDLGTVGSTYGNRFLIPLAGGSGGGGSRAIAGGGGGGGILVAASGSIRCGGSSQVEALGGLGSRRRSEALASGAGSGGSVRFVASEILGAGSVDCWSSADGVGWVRFDSPSVRYTGHIYAIFSSGFQPILFPVLGQGLHLSIQSVGGVAVSPNPTGLAATPDAVLSAGVPNPVPVVVRCVGVPLGTDIRIEARGGSGEVVAGVGKNTVGSEADSLATVSVNLPRGSGTLMARARLAVLAGANGAAGRSEGGGTTGASSSDLRLSDLPYSVTGLTTDGERIASVEVEAVAGGGSRTVYVTESGKRLPAPSDR